MTDDELLRKYADHSDDQIAKYISQETHDPQRSLAERLLLLRRRAYYDSVAERAGSNPNSRMGESGRPGSSLPESTPVGQASASSHGVPMVAESGGTNRKKAGCGFFFWLACLAIVGVWLLAHFFGS